jgi:hypothetical protein
LGLLCFLTIGPFPLSFPLKIDGISVVIAVLGGLIARELGGKRQAILVAAVAASIAGPVVFSGSWPGYGCNRLRSVYGCGSRASGRHPEKVGWRDHAYFSEGDHLTGTG